MQKGLIHSVEFYESILNSFSEGVYVLNRNGDYLFINDAYIEMLNMTRDTLLNYNTHDFLTSGRVNFCISDLVIEKKRKVTVFQDIHNSPETSLVSFRVIATVAPIFNELGQIEYLVGITKKLAKIENDIADANRSALQSMVLENNIDELDEEVICESQSMRRIADIVKIIAEIDAPVLITGESGTGKEVVAKLIHRSGNRSSNRIVTINCATLPENLLEAELFGYEKGAFTGALTTGKIGLLQVADNGTLFLDEINSLPLSLQGKILRAIETKTFRRIGSTKDTHSNFRLITATNQDLESLVKEKGFRTDLYYRLNVIPVEIPPLRERREDIVPLANLFLNQYCKKYGKQKCFSERLTKWMEIYHWPGNVRELRNYVERSVAMSIGYIIDIFSTNFQDQNTQRFPVQGSNFTFTSIQSDKQIEKTNLPDLTEEWLSKGTSLREYLNHCEAKYLKAVLKKTKSSYKAADILQISQTSVIRKKKKYGL